MRAAVLSVLLLGVALPAVAAPVPLPKRAKARPPSLEGECKLTRLDDREEPPTLTLVGGALTDSAILFSHCDGLHGRGTLAPWQPSLPGALSDQQARKVSARTGGMGHVLVPRILPDLVCRPR